MNPGLRVQDLCAYPCCCLFSIADGNNSLDQKAGSQLDSALPEPSKAGKSFSKCPCLPPWFGGHVPFQQPLTSLDQSLHASKRSGRKRKTTAGPEAQTQGSCLPGPSDHRSDTGGAETFYSRISESPSRILQILQCLGCEEFPSELGRREDCGLAAPSGRYCAALAAQSEFPP